MNPAARISVVMPTYNCAPLMARHLESVVKWADLADEIVVVDSRSTDGTLDIIRAGLSHRNLRIIERDRGLYESWNEGIAATSGEWVYISTAGDTIERTHLLHLLEIGERGDADVVISAPRFVDEVGKPRTDPGWPPREVVLGSGFAAPFVLSPDASFALAFMHFPCALLGSSASNLYRGTHLRARPFPADFKGSGDSAWVLRHAAQSRICFTQEVGSTFCMHPKEDQLTGEKWDELQRKCADEKQRSLAQPGLNAALALLLGNHHRLLGEIQAVQRERRSLWHDRPMTFAKLGAWFGLNVTYLRKRHRMKNVRRRIEREFLNGSAYQQVSSRG